MTTIKTNRVAGAATANATKRVGTSAITDNSSKRTDLPRYRRFEGDVSGFHLLEGDRHGLFRELEGDQK